MDLRILTKIFIKKEFIKNYKKILNITLFHYISHKRKKYIIIIFNQYSIVSEYKSNGHSYYKIFYLIY